jgi:uncharacterized protein DUF6950
MAAGINALERQPDLFRRAAAFGYAFEAAMAPFSWQHPCLLWLADYAKIITGTDPAANWRGVTWSEKTALAELTRLAATTPADSGNTNLERVLVAMGEKHGWKPVPAGAGEIGVHEIGDLGFPSIKNPADEMWLLNATDGLRMTRALPARAWRLACA